MYKNKAILPNLQYLNNCYYYSGFSIQMMFLLDIGLYFVIM